MIVIIFMLLTAFALFSGLALMACDGKIYKKYKNTLMLLRVLLQGIALLILLAR